MKKENLELRRQAFHLMFGFVIVSLYMLNILTITNLTLIFFIGLVASLLSCKYNIPGVYWFLKNFEREKDIKTSPGRGVLTYMGGAILTLILFEEKIALAAIMILAVGDSISHLVGKHFGKRKYLVTSKKHLEGTVAGIFFASLVASLFVGSKMAFIGSLAAMIFESIEMKLGKNIIDDNLIIPLVAGIVMSLL
ncbi:MAG: SEC59/DGK1/VTE5 family protein [Nanoarchaeota archaeon]|nr:SEC59/DGK1/VTE5 family protein [Nanoarchaeota archaeon]